MRGRQVKVKGERALRRELRRLERAYPDAMQHALTEEAMDVLAASQPLTPVDLGDLVGSGVVGRLPGSDAGAVVAYGKSYALPVHERTEVAHAGKTQAKYLEQPFEELSSGMQARIVQRIKRKVVV